MKSTKKGLRVFHETPEERDRRIEREFENRLVLYCPECDEMRQYAADSLTWFCSECGGGDLSTGRVKELIGR